MFVVPVYVAFLVPILVHWSPGSLAALPKWVHRVDSCPDPDNISQWLEASKELNCYHNLTSNDPNKQEKVYHCLPSSFLNETVEFCGRNVPVEAGNCPVYNYEVSQNKMPTSYNCSTFSSGCPEKQYFSKEVYDYAACLSLNRQGRCFKADPHCRNISKFGIHIADRFTEDPLYYLFILLMVPVIIILLVIVLVWLCRRRMKEEKGIVSKHELEPLEEKDVVSKHELEPLETTSDDGKEITTKTVVQATDNGEETEQESAEQIDDSEASPHVIHSGTSLIPTAEMIEEEPHKYDVEIGTDCQCKGCVLKKNLLSKNQ